MLVPPPLREEVPRLHELQPVLLRKQLRRRAVQQRVSLRGRRVDLRGRRVRVAPAAEVRLAVLEHRLGEQDRVPDVLQARDADAALGEAAGHHHAGLELVDPVACEDGAVARVEERVVLEEGDGVDGCFQGAGQGCGCSGGGGCHVGVCLADDCQEGRAVLGVLRRREVGGFDVARAAVDDEARLDLDGRRGLALVLHF
ncbi:hypothetical protein CCHR01_10753 [Colletotrichum chrysophilum]|uniref:Uncharacterized protein n=1 Tax=Colletotrichum chrysophilum TaxID=1836956 RepID=A0AAD9AJD1_9PEZI|nr:hypothetical protein CCHR01_10753 [Colletotrichum chrysophilum]